MTLDAGSRFVVSGKLVGQAGSEMLLAGFYSNNATKSKINGFFTTRLNAETGDVIGTSFREMDKSMAGSPDAAGGASADNPFHNQYHIRTVDVNPADGSYVMTAEISNYTRHQERVMERVNGQMTTNWVTWHRFTNDDVLLIGANKDGGIRWLNVMPKMQVEEFSSNTSFNGPAGFYELYSDYFAKGGGMPYYSSYRTLLHNNQLLLLLNDHQENRDVRYGAPLKPVKDFKDRSNLYGVTVDLASGKTERKVIATNSEELILMPRHSYITGNEVLIPSLRGRTLAKTELKMAKLSIK